MRGQFTFYASFLESIKYIRKPADRCAAYEAIIHYALEGIEPDMDKLPDGAAIAFAAARPNLDASRRKAEGGRKGGRSTPQASGKDAVSEESAEASAEDTASEKENEKEGEREIEIENECSLPPTPSPEDLFEGELLEAVREWLAYKRERRESYKPTGLRSLLSQIQSAADAHGSDEVAALIRTCMASGYRGITFDRLRSQAPASRRPPTAAESKARGKAHETPLSDSALQDILGKI